MSTNNNTLINFLFPDEKKTAYEADFLDVSESLSRFNHGFCLNGTHCETIQDSLMNSIVFGSTGNLKSAGIVIPTILKAHKYSSLVIHDPTGELRKCAAWLKKSGVAVKTLNWSNAKYTEGYNPLQRAVTNSDIMKISKMLISSSLGTGGKDPFWNLAAENLITFTIMYYKKYRKPEEQNLYCVYHFISLLLHSPDKADKLIVKTGDSMLLSEYKSFIAYGSKMLSSIAATCRTALAIFGTDPEVAQITSYDTLDFFSCKKQRTAIFINTKIQDQKYYAVITNILLQQFFGELMNQLPEKKDLPVLFIVEEASSLYFEGLPLLLANCRKFLCCMLQVYQSKGQLVDLYGPALSRSILENSHATVYMGGQPLAVAQELEAMLGKFEYHDEKGIRHVRSLLTANEIHELSDSILILGNKRPIKTRTVPFFRQFFMNRKTQLPPYQPEGKIPVGALPPLKFD